MKIKASSFIYLLLFLSVGCQVKTNDVDTNLPPTNPEDLAQKFYDHLKKNDYSKTYPLYVDTFFNNVDTASILKFYQDFKKEGGQIKSFKITKRESKAYGTDSLHRLNCDVQRSKKMTSEILEIVSGPETPPRILHYVQRKTFTRKIAFTLEAEEGQAED